MIKALRAAILSGLVVLSMHAPPGAATIPDTINYQGYLTSSLGVPVNIGVPMTFRIYNAAVGGSPLWSETHGPIPVVNGNFNVSLGSVTPINLNFDVPYWITLEVGTDGEMLPRQAMSTIPYAAVAAGLDSGAQVQGSQISGAISTATIAGSQVTGVINATTAATATALSGTITGAQITGDIVAAGNLKLVNSTPTAGNIMKGTVPFIHNFGTLSTYVGEAAGNFTLTGSDNTAIGATTMQAVTTGFGNTAAGSRALKGLTTGFQNSAFGTSSLIANTGGNNNTALGQGAMLANTGGSGNLAVGLFALQHNVTGNNNTAVGIYALDGNTSGSDNIALGANAGSLVTAGSKNIHIGNVGSAADSGVIRIGITGDQNAIYLAAVRSVTVTSPLQVVIGSDGQLGTIPSTRTRKEAIVDMGDASDTLMRLRPVTFQYTDLNTTGDHPRQYGLIAEEVAEVAPDLVAHSADGKIESVFYQHLSPMLLNEYQKQQRTIRAQAADLAAQRARMEALERDLAEIRALLRAR